MFKHYKMLVRFECDGFLGREYLDFEAADIELELAAWFELERLAIVEGFSTHECGCCLDPKYVKIEKLNVELLNITDVTPE